MESSWGGEFGGRVLGEEEGERVLGGEGGGVLPPPFALTVCVLVTPLPLPSDGELVLMDAGCEYHGYVSDVTRTWPVNGKFSAAQRDLYEVVRTTKQEVTEVTPRWVCD